MMGLGGINKDIKKKTIKMIEMIIYISKIVWRENTKKIAETQGSKLKQLKTN